jgi:hypothetical protein
VGAVRRRKGRLIVSGRVAAGFTGRVTVTACARRSCRRVKVTARKGRFRAVLHRPAGPRITVTAAVGAGRGFRAAVAQRTVRR